MTVGLLVDAALEDRIQQTLKAHQATCPNPKGHPLHNPPARWVFQYCVGIHLLRVPGQGAFVLHLNDQHLHLLRLLGRSYEACYALNMSGAVRNVGWMTVAFRADGCIASLVSYASEAPLPSLHLVIA